MCIPVNRNRESDNSHTAPLFRIQRNLQKLRGGLRGSRIDGTAAGLVNIQREQRVETVALGFCQRVLFEIQQVEAPAEQ